MFCIIILLSRQFCFKENSRECGQSASYNYIRFRILVQSNFSFLRIWILAQMHNLTALCGTAETDTVLRTFPHYYRHLTGLMTLPILWPPILCLSLSLLLPPSLSPVKPGGTGALLPIVAPLHDPPNSLAPDLLFLKEIGCLLHLLCVGHLRVREFGEIFMTWGNMQV